MIAQSQHAACVLSLEAARLRLRHRTRAMTETSITDAAIDLHVALGTLEMVLSDREDYRLTTAHGLIGDALNKLDRLAPAVPR